MSEGVKQYRCRGLQPRVSPCYGFWCCWLSMSFRSG